jgi:4a-hydroxytetrahydrobiopterin dehydratase
MTELHERSCEPCKGGVDPLAGRALETLQAGLEDGWKIVEEHHLEKTFLFPDFRQALAFTNAVGELAEEQGHHPDFHLAWGRVTLTIWTHKIDGLAEADFIFAAKTDRLLAGDSN